MPEILANSSTSLYLTHAADVANKKTFPFYGTWEDAHNYFYMHPKFDCWDDIDRQNQIRFLVQATRIVDRLNFVGQKADEDQDLQFPRTGGTSVPIQIMQATYEIALRLIEGYDPDMEVDNLQKKSQGYAGTKTDYDRSYVPDYIKAGVPSSTAWNLLLPYLRDPHSILLLRGS
jgi:hypothetical protein